MDSLPNELLAEIVKWVKAPLDLLSIALTSRRLSEHAVECIWARPRFSTQQQIIQFANVLLAPLRNKDLTQALNYSRLIRKLSFSSFKRQTSSSDIDSVIPQLFACLVFERLERLSLAGLKLHQSTLASICLSCPSLLSLDAGGVQIETDALLVNSVAVLPVIIPNSLVSLNLSGIAEVKNSDIISISSTLSNLKRLWLDNCVNVGDGAIAALALNCPKLAELYISNLPNLTFKSIASILSIPESKSSSNQCSSTATPVLNNLRELNMAGCINISAGEMLHPTNYSVLPMDNFRSLNLSHNPNLSTSTLSRVLLHLPYIRQLTLMHCSALTDNGLIESIPKLSKSIQLLHLGNCVRITDLAVIAIAKECTKLKYLDLANLSITDASCEQISKTLTRLRRLSIVKCRNISSLSLHHLQRIAPNFQRLHLSYCAQLTLPPLIGLLERSRSLTYLTLTGCPLILAAIPNPKWINEWSRAAPENFTESQRIQFCVLSCEGLQKFRRALCTKKEVDIFRAKGASGVCVVNEGNFGESFEVGIKENAVGGLIGKNTEN
ncbi:hypothetical protein BDR26DRAFT_833377 [Obelidium mucronatum]|nr:hypothetical protein BDR26DRAFT_833377 [Obelidium mucronatum]